MDQVKYKYPEVNLLGVASQWKNGDWGRFTKKCVANQDIERLKGTYYGLQRGMATAVRLKASSQELVEVFLRMQHSIETALKMILIAKYPTLQDNPLRMRAATSEEIMISRKNKKVRDQEFQKFLRDARF